MDTAKKKKRIKTAALLLLALSLAAMLTVSLSLSYLVADRSKENVFVIGSVGLELIENGFPEDKQSRTLAPGDRVTKQPCVMNTGSNAEYVFISVTLPLYEVITVNDEHKLNETEKVRREIFNLLSTDTDKRTVSTPADFTVSGIGVLEYSSSYELVRADEDLEKNTHTYYFGYKKLLQPTNTPTEKLFEELQLRSLLEGEVPDDAENTVTVAAYGIQADELPASLRPMDESSLTGAELSAILEVYMRQEVQLI